MLLSGIKKLGGWVAAAAARVRSLFGRGGAAQPEAVKPAELGIDRARLVLAASIAANFAEQHAPDGTAWQPVQRPVPPPPLDVTGTLKLAAIEAGRTAQVTDDGVVVAMTTPYYARYQDQGTATIPAREFFGVSDEAAAEIAEETGEKALVFIMDGRRK